MLAYNYMAIIRVIILGKISGEGRGACLCDTILKIIKCKTCHLVA